MISMSTGRASIRLLALLAAILAWTPSVGLAHLTTPPHDGPGFFQTSADVVTACQRILVQEGYLESGGYQTGSLDTPTMDAARAFQRRHGLPPTGLLDLETVVELHSHYAEGDSDGDGVLDSRDRCPGTPIGVAVDGNGCPRDSDGDGVLDDDDRCPDTPRGTKVDDRGCPRDSDGDGVLDGDDRCPDSPRGARVDARGCTIPEPPAPPPPAPIFEKGKESLVLEGVNFETNSATLTAASKPALDRVARSLNDWPDVRVEVGGHTDSAGGEAHNLRLSEARARSVRDYLAGQGVDPDRLRAKGYGESRPIADNATAAGRAKNRRVELTRVD
jgi:outer membrane protein OmpA-like peptidoglycan-associated protein